jgi:hypothetical protein
MPLVFQPRRWKPERSKAKSLFKIALPDSNALTPSRSSFLRRQESSAFTFNGWKALDPSLRWDDEQNQAFPKGIAAEAAPAWTLVAP